jgi:hypothetical protein
MDKKERFRTYIKCYECQSIVHRWYVVDDSDFCVLCYCRLFEDRLTKEDLKRLEKEEDYQNGQ